MMLKKRIPGFRRASFLGTSQLRSDAVHGFKLVKSRWGWIVLDQDRNRIGLEPMPERAELRIASYRRATREGGRAG